MLGRWAIYGALIGGVGNLLPVAFAGRPDLWDRKPIPCIRLKGAIKLQRGSSWRSATFRTETRPEPDESR